MSEDTNGTAIVIVGNPCDGFQHFGPFATYEEADHWALKNQPGDEWWIAWLVAAEVSTP